VEEALSKHCQGTKGRVIEGEKGEWVREEVKCGSEVFEGRSGGGVLNIGEERSSYLFFRDPLQ
jgi:hypothetical protein